jgi:predicted histidine transporter YuiF (NhaC family)
LIDIVIMIGLIIDLIAAFMIYYGKIFRSTETIEQMSKHSEHEIKHRTLETRLARLGAILIIVGFIIQILGYA